ncbi:MAG: TonB-dependent receptor [Gammaproteobacteria bacterium]|nr:TonB-dependent receptor [Gammaproteobacteria bacterium]
MTHTGRPGGFAAVFTRPAVQLTASICVGLAVTPPVVAQALEEIVVSARRLEENRQEIPVAVSVIGAQRIELEAIRDLANVADLTPSLQFDQGFWPNDTRVSIRGLFARAGRPSAAILVDGIDTGTEQLESAGGSALLNQRLIDVERVEVVKGPQSALYGRAAFGGAINYITRRPTMEWTGNGSADLAEHGRKEFRLGVSGPLVEDKLAIRALGSYYDLDGYYRNPNTGRELGGGTSKGAALGLLWSPVDTLNAYLNLTYSEDDFAPPAIAAVKANETLGPVAGNRLRAVTGKISAKESDINISPDPRNPLFDYPGTNDETLRVSLILDWEIGSVTLESRTGYLDSEQFLRMDTTQQFGFTAPSAGNNSDANYLWKYEQWQQEFILRPTEAGRWNWLVGAQVFSEDASDLSNSAVWFRDPGNAGCGLPNFDLEPIACDFADTQPLNKTIFRDTTSYSAFGLIGFELTDQVAITAEGRVIYDEVEVSATGVRDLVITRGLAETIQPVFLSPGFRPLPHDKVDDTNFVPRVSVDYSPAEGTLVYFSAANGIKPPTFNATDLIDPSINRVDKEDLWAYELGAKTGWLDNTLLLNGAFFFNDYQDQQILVQFEASAPGGIPRSGTANASKVEVWGLELEMLWRPTENWTLSAAYTFTDGEFKDFNLAQIQGPNNPVSTSNQVKAGNADADFSGNDVAGVPDHAFAFLGRYERQFPGRNNLNWFAQMTGNYQGERFADISNLVVLDSYWLANLQLGLESEAWSLVAYAENLFDDDTIRYAQEFIDQQDGFVFGSGFAFPVAYYAYLPQPRTVGLRFLFRTP